MKALLLATALATVAVAATAAPAHAQAAAQATPGPAQVVEQSARRVLSVLDARHAQFRQDPAALKTFVSGELDQIFDRDYAARLVLGPYARGASAAEVREFADALTDNLMQRYGTALLDFNSTLRVQVVSQSPLPNNIGVIVNTRMLRAGGAPVPVSYLMRQSNGRWKVFDVMIEGVSYVQTFRSQFAGPLSRSPIAQIAADLRAGRIDPGATPR
jgi:phospholipid transport system substrate-binding protein